VDEIATRADELMGQKNWDGAEDYYLSCLQAAVRAGDLSLELSLCSELMGFFRMRCKEESALPVIERGLSLLEELDVRGTSRGTILINAATSLSSFGYYERALQLYRQAEEVYRHSIGPNDALYAALYNNMSSVYSASGDYPMAEQCTQRALTILLTYPHHLDLATTYVNLAILYAYQNRDDSRIEPCLRKAMEVFDDPEVLWEYYYAHTARKCADAFEALEHLTEAQDLRERADLIYERN